MKISNIMLKGAEVCLFLLEISIFSMCISAVSSARVHSCMLCLLVVLKCTLKGQQTQSEVMLHEFLIEEETHGVMSTCAILRAVYVAQSSNIVLSTNLSYRPVHAAVDHNPYVHTQRLPVMSGDSRQFGGVHAIR